MTTRERPTWRRKQVRLNWRVEVDWDLDGFGPNDDISYWVRHLSFNSGLNGQVASVGSAKIILDNRSGDFRPEIPGSRFGPRMKPRLPVRILDGAKPLWTGYTNDWEVVNALYRGNKACTLNCKDFMDILQTHTVSFPIQENQRSDLLVRHIVNDALRAPVATQTMSFIAQPTAGDYIVIHGHVFQYVNSFTANPWSEVKLGANIYATIDNTLAAVNGGPGEGTTYKFYSRPDNQAAGPTPSFLSLGRRLNPMRWYRLGDIGTTVIKDWGRNALNGTANFTPLGVESALYADYATLFDGTSGRVSIPTASFFNGASFSIEAWVKPSATPPAAQAIFGAWDSYATGKSMYLQVRSDGSVYFSNYFDDLQTAAGLVPFGGAATHVVMTYNHHTMQRRIYVNGVQVAQNTATSHYTDINPSMFIGADETGPLHFFKGVIDEFALYDYSLTDDRVLAHYGAGDKQFSVITADNPRRYYRLNEGVGTTAVDMGSDAQNGTYQGTFTLKQAGLVPALYGDLDKSMGFDGVSYAVSVPPLDIANRDFWVAAWIYPYLAGLPAAQTFFSARDSDTTRKHLHLRVSNTGQLTVDYYNDGTTTAAGTIRIGTWTHVAVKYTVATDTTTIYINGKFFWSGNIGPFEGAAPAIYIGRFGPGATETWNGAIDEVMISWGDITEAQVKDLYDSRSVAPGMIITSRLRGAVGNGYYNAASNPASIVLSGAGWLTGGVDLPPGASIEAGKDTFSIAGDQWNSEQTNAMTCIQDVCDSEQSFFWVGRDGCPVYKNRDFQFKQTVAAPRAKLTQEQKLGSAVNASEVYNIVKVSVTPRETLATGVVARAENTITAEGTSQKNTDGSWTRKVSSDDKQPNVTTVSLQFVDPGTGKISGAKNLTLPPAPGTDYTAWDFPDATGFNYTNNGLLTFGVITKTTGIEVDIHNAAIGPLYLFNFQVRGQAIVAYNPVTKEARDVAGVNLYGTRVLSISLPLTSSEALADAIAHYLLSRYKEPKERVTQIDMGMQRETVDGFNLFDLNIGDVLHVSDEAMGSTAQKYLLTGYSVSMEPGDDGSGNVATTLNVQRLDDVTYGIIDDVSYGLLDTSMRLSI